MGKPAQPKFKGRARLMPVLASALLLGACATNEGPQSTVNPASLGVSAGESGNPIADAAYWGGQYEQNPGDAETAAKYGEALRQLKSFEQAMTVLSVAARQHPDHAGIMAEYGKVLVAAGQSEKAIPVLVKAATLNPSDWRVLTAQGVAYDQQGQHAEAQMKYRSALKLAPNHPSILTNLGLSEALAGELTEAEQTLRGAVSNPSAGAKARQNLALVLGLKGEFDEAARLAKADLPPAVVNNNIDYIRSMLVQPALWKQMEQLDAPIDTQIQ